MARIEILAMWNYNIIDKKTFSFSGSKRTLIKNVPNRSAEFNSTLTRCYEISGKSKNAHFAVVYRESRIFFQSAEPLIAVISIYPYKFSFSCIHCAKVLYQKNKTTENRNEAPM